MHAVKGEEKNHFFMVNCPIVVDVPQAEQQIKLRLEVLNSRADQRHGISFKDLAFKSTTVLVFSRSTLGFKERPGPVFSATRLPINQPESTASQQSLAHIPGAN